MKDKDKQTRLWIIVSICLSCDACLLDIYRVHDTVRSIFSTRKSISWSTIISSFNASIIRFYLLESFLQMKIKSNAIVECNETCTSHLRLISKRMSISMYIRLTIYVYDQCNWFRWLSWSIHIFKFTFMIDCDSFDFASAIRQPLSSCNEQQMTMSSTTE